MPGYTKTFTITDAADVAVTAQTTTAEITVREDAAASGWPNGDFVVKKPFAASTPIQMPTGSAYTFKKGSHYAPGDVVGYVRLPTGGTSTTFQQDEA